MGERQVSVGVVLRGGRPVMVYVGMTALERTVKRLLARKTWISLELLLLLGRSTDASSVMEWAQTYWDKWLVVTACVLEKIGTLSLTLSQDYHSGVATMLLNKNCLVYIFASKKLSTKIVIFNTKFAGNFRKKMRMTTERFDKNQQILREVLSYGWLSLFRRLMKPLCNLCLNNLLSHTTSIAKSGEHGGCWTHLYIWKLTSFKFPRLSCFSSLVI